MTTHELNAENLNATIKDSRVSLEPGYLEFLRSQGYVVEELLEAHTVKRSDSDTAHVVLNVTTYDKPSNSPELDAVADEIDLWVCDCWAFRSGSADVRDDEPPSDCGTCPHIRAVSKVENAQADDSQDTLV